MRSFIGIIAVISLFSGSAKATELDYPNAYQCLYDIDKSGVMPPGDLTFHVQPDGRDLAGVLSSTGKRAYIFTPDKIYSHEMPAQPTDRVQGLDVHELNLNVPGYVTPVKIYQWDTQDLTIRDSDVKLLKAPAVAAEIAMKSVGDKQIIQQLQKVITKMPKYIDVHSSQAEQKQDKKGAKFGKDRLERLRDSLNTCLDRNFDAAIGSKSFKTELIKLKSDIEDVVGRGSHGTGAGSKEVKANK